MPQQQRQQVLGERESVAAAALADTSVIATLSVSADGCIAAANRTMARLLGEQDAGSLIGRPVAELLASGEDANVWLGARAGVQRDVEVRLESRRGNAVVLRGDIFASEGTNHGLAAFGVFADYTELDKLRRSMQRSARLEALASLTGGVAHDFNNLLTVLIGNLSLIAEELRGRPQTFAKLKASRDAAKRGSDLIRQLLGFARSEEVERSVVDPSAIIRNVVPLLNSALGSKVQLKTELESGAGSINANVAQLESVIVNLAVNARDAISGHGTVKVSSTAVRPSEAEARELGLDRGDYIRVSVADNGAGIPAELLERVFEPFFSTKEDRGGTGLGLSMVQAFARQMGGRAVIRSETGTGTVVSLWLPRAEDSADTGDAKTRPLSTLPTGTEHVAVLAADEGLSSTIREILEVLGYTVSVCRDAAGLETAAGGDAIRLLIVDGWPEASSPARRLIERMRSRSAGLRVICLHDSAGPAASAPADAAATLLKPFSLADLSSLVRETLDR